MYLTPSNTTIYMIFLFLLLPAVQVYYLANIYALVVAFILGVIYFYFHQNRKKGIIGFIKDRIAGFTLKRTDHIIASSKLAAHLLETQFAYPPNKISLCNHLGVDTLAYSPITVWNSKTRGLNGGVILFPDGKSVISEMEVMVFSGFGVWSLVARSMIVSFFQMALIWEPSIRCARLRKHKLLLQFPTRQRQGL